MKTRSQPHVSFVLATHNRCAVVERTLSQLLTCGLDRHEFEIIVVDNASNDRTPDVIASSVDILVRLRTNYGSCAKAYGVKRASSRFVVFLDDDSHPRAGSVERMIRHFEANSKLAAAGFTVHLPDGEEEDSALPDVFVGCGVGFRREALDQVGGLDHTFFMQAEEYDLSFRMAHAGWEVRVFDDLQVNHEKTSDSRRTDRTTYYDIRNNLRVLARYLSPPVAGMYRHDWRQRYAWLAESRGHIKAFRRGELAGMLYGLFERSCYRRRRLNPQVFERFFRWGFVDRKMRGLAESRIHRIILADLGKNILAFRQAADAAGIEILAIGDDRFAAPRRSYRGIPLFHLADALRTGADAVVVANMSRVQSDRTRTRLSTLTTLPVHAWFVPPGETKFVGGPTPVNGGRMIAKEGLALGAGNYRGHSLRPLQTADDDPGAKVGCSAHRGGDPRIRT